MQPIGWASGITFGVALLLTLLLAGGILRKPRAPVLTTSIIGIIVVAILLAALFVPESLLIVLWLGMLAVFGGAMGTFVALTTEPEKHDPLPFHRPTPWRRRTARNSTIVMGIAFMICGGLLLGMSIIDLFSQ